MSDPVNPDILQAIRKAHCAKGNDPPHDCVGTCSITPTGIVLSCELCGDGDEPTAPSPTSDAAMRVRAVLEAVGLDYDKLNPEAQREAIKEMARDLCPGCRRLRTVSDRAASAYYHCPCGGWLFSGIAWRKDVPNG